MAQPSSHSSADDREVARFSALADEWWRPRGKFATLHALNPARLAFIREQALARFDRPGTARTPFAGLSLLDVGCGGGFACEPMARLGFSVTGLDASETALATARTHAGDQGLAIDYRQGVAEDLAASDERWDVLLALEVIEHVANPAAFLRDCLDLLAPGGLMVLSTLNRTARSLLLGKLAAEYLLRWAPAGAHDWRRFLTPSEVTAMVAPPARRLAGPVGLTFSPMAGAWRRSDDVSINYLMAFGPPS